MADLPTGTVTFLFTDIEGSTRLLGQHPNEYAAALLRHDDLLRQAVAGHEGVVFETVGDAIYAAFALAPNAVHAALDAQLALGRERWGRIGRLRVRMAIHRGAVERRGSHYFGAPLYRCARLMAIGYGAQTLLSAATEEAVRGVLPPGLSLRAMGSHRLKDLAEPEQVFQLTHPDLAVDFPPLKSLNERHTMLPTPLTSFVGRNNDRVEVARLLDDGRLLTLTGPGGIGKTRLALQLAADQVAAFDNGIYFVGLAPLRDPALVPKTIAQTLGVPEEPAEDLTVSLAKFLRDKELLLVLDNFEQVAGGASFLGGLLSACPKLKIVATSRSPLHLSVERQFAVLPLDVSDRSADTDGSPPSDAVVLFLQRALAAKHDFAMTNADLSVIAQICARLDGLPLSIELAAARSKVLTPQAMLPLLQRRLPLLTSQLLDSPARQRSVAATIDWSYRLLHSEEQRLFRQLAVFVGGCTIDAANSVVTAGPADRFDGLSGLVDHSFLRQEGQPDGSPRFVMLETIREYGLDRLSDLGELDGCQLRHAECYAALAERASSEMSGSSQIDWLERLQAENENLRAALSWAISRGDAQLAARLAGSLAFFWVLRGQVTEGRARVRSILDLGAALSSASRAHVLYRAGQLAWAQGDYAEAIVYLDESVALLEGLGDLEGQVRSLAALATARVQQGDFVNATTIATETMRLARQVGDERSISLSLGVLATAALEQEDYQTAEAMFNEGLAAFRRKEDKRGIADTLVNIGWVLVLAGDLVRASRALKEGIRLAEEIGNRRAIAFATLYLGLVAFYEGGRATATYLLHESLSLGSELGDQQVMAECATALGSLSAVQGKAWKAARLWGGAEAVYKRMGARMGHAERTVRERYLDDVRSELGGESFAVAWAEGAAMTSEELIGEALTVDRA